MLWCIGACLLAIAAGPLSPVQAPQPPDLTVGAYEVTVAGHFKGKGTAAVGVGTITISVPVRQQDGQSGTLVVANLPLNKGRFSGQGTVLGRPVTISGRLDPPDGKILKRARLSATFLTVENRGGRLSGFRTGS